MNRTRVHKWQLATTAVALVAAAATAHVFTRAGHNDQSADLRRAIDSGRAKNVIMFLGDGMGDSEITSARNYQVGANGRLWIDTLPLTGEYTTYALQESNPALIDYVTDSAASGTGWSTGYKTSNGRISSIAGTGATVTRLDTILELAQKAGFKTGNVSTAELTDATPAVLNSHINDRGCQGPSNMSTCGPSKKENGGLGSIAEQSVDHHVNVLLGGGKQRFDQTITGGPHVGKSVIQSAQMQGYNVVLDATSLQMANGPRVLGLFNAGNMSLEWSGLLAAPSPGSGLPAGQTCAENQRPINEPSLAAMTTKAIDLLHEDDGAGPWRQHDEHFQHRRSRGFFLQVEGASIDKQDHVEAPCQQIGETIAFDRAVKVALDFARTHGDTLIIVTADHAHTSQIVPVPSLTETTRPGTLSTLLTKVDRSLMTMNYGTRAHGESQDHTGSEVRIAAQGPQAASVVGVTNQTDLFHTMARALGIE
ncbi:MAG TPA: alkaline phosphatase [Vicinamibacterales bacterium]|jgi:alkaline phosphatase/streptomycin-6-phosphatase